MAFGLRLRVPAYLSTIGSWAHDAASTVIDARFDRKLIAAISVEQVGGLFAQPVHDTVKQVIDGRVQTIPRETLWLAQTPQMFRAHVLLDALNRAQTSRMKPAPLNFVVVIPSWLKVRRRAIVS